MKPQTKKTKPKILLAMSGGVDSSVAALLLKKQGYKIIGAFMKNWSDTKNDLGECKWREERRMAIKITAILNIPLITLDFEKQYKKQVVNEMFRLYKKGITPNPDVDCNNKIKFPLLIKEAKKLGCDFIATGHYARIKRINVNDRYRKQHINKNSKKKKVLIIDKNYASKASLSSGGASVCTRQFQTNLECGHELDGKRCNYQLFRAKDESKDQSYFLYRLTQKNLKNTLFPIGELTKKQVRAIAKKARFPNHDKKSTVGICFIGKVNLKKFLQKKIPSKPGKILNPEAEVIGEHDGIFYYTIGQRIGPRFGIDLKKPEKYQKKWYVARKVAKKNIIIAAPEGHSLNFREEIWLKNEHWINDNPLNDSKKREPINKKISLVKNKSIANKVSLIMGWSVKKSIKVLSRIRQVGELLPSTLIYDKKNKKFKITLNKPITGVSEGQAIVLYQGKKCLGGGVIRFG